MYFNGMFNGNEWDDRALYTVLDDIHVDWFLKHYKQFLGCQKQFTMTDKWVRKQKVNYNMPAILLMNDDQLDKFREGWNQEWIDANCVYIRLENKLYWYRPDNSELLY